MRDQRCLRGLLFRYRTERALPEDWIDALRRCFEHCLVTVEQWGSQRITRVVVPFRFEVTTGERHDEMSLLFRVSADRVQQASDRRLIESLLAVN